MLPPPILNRGYAPPRPISSWRSRICTSRIRRATFSLTLTHLLSRAKNRFDVRAVYLEMNRFDINYDRWYFDLFAYTEYSADPEDLDWLSD